MSSVTSIRRVALTNIHLPINFVHGHLGKSKRLVTDKGMERVDIINVDVFIDYVDKYSSASKTLDNLFSYSVLYEQFCDCLLKTTSQPLEWMLDEIIKIVEATAKKQGIELYRVKVVSHREGLDPSKPATVSCKHYQEMPILDRKIDTRISGVSDFPFYTTIQHDWVKDGDKIEHMDTRFESLLIDFSVITIRENLRENCMEHLFNYTTVLNYLYEKQGSKLTDCLESVTDNLIQVILHDCSEQGVTPMLVECSLRRTAFPRAMPFIGIRKVFI